MEHRLGEIAQVYYGPHEKADTEGKIKYFVSSHFDSFFEPSIFKDSYVDIIKDTDKYLLRPNDLIITGKGQRLFAWAYKEKYGEVVPSSLFYIVKLQDKSKVLGEYLAIVLNSEQMSHTLKAISGGTSIPSIKKKELEQLQLFIPSIEKQRQVIKLSNLLDQDIELAMKLTEKKTTLKKGLLNRIINNTKTE